ncbi:acyl-CoA synthetase [Marivibrio halodurans]|uniref:Acyl-CoA synthetase n=1 Tax=Marivibrio halodurans TaxID=2039722 RepID=A0A8J7RZ97_9PROT|nr:acyl-CoA synthetase [Marivibrio halodurans]MBP5857315.1 acyl-CoA synthetase [Marivibrio halodurans]
MLTRAADYRALRDGFRWTIPERYNIGVDCSDKHAPDRLALIYRAGDGSVTRYRFGDLSNASNRVANLLTAKGIARGDRVAVLLPQAPETAFTHLGVYKAGMVAVPLFTLFGEEALEYRLKACGARALVTDAASLPKIAAIRDRLPDLDLVLSVDGAGDGAEDFHALMARASDRFTPVDTGPDDPALIIFTSGTTGQPKGALHGHRVLLGHLPGVELPQEFFPAEGDLFWTPADWAWIGGLIDVLLPSLHHGVPVLAHRAGKFDPEEAFRVLADFGVRNAFMPPTALKLMRQVPDPARHGYRMRSIGSGGETLGEELLAWGRETFGLTINEFYGQTECNLVLSNCAGLMDVRPGSMGRAVPGHRVGIVDAEGRELPDGQDGNIAVKAPDPVMFLGYWNNAAATRAKFAGDWLLTGDTGRRDDDGYFWYVGRDDDVITTAGYRVGPGEIEDCLMAHPAVAMAAVVGVPDPVRTQAIKAFIVPAPGHLPSDELAEAIKAHVRTKLAAHEYPRIVAFVDSLPMTATGKIIRRELRARHE